MLALGGSPAAPPPRGARCCWRWELRRGRLSQGKLPLGRTPSAPPSQGPRSCWRWAPRRSRTRRRWPRGCCRWAARRPRRRLWRVRGRPPGGAREGDGVAATRNEGESWAARNPACGGDSRSCSPQSAHRRARLSRVLLWPEPSLGQESRACVGSISRANLGASLGFLLDGGYRVTAR